MHYNKEEVVAMLKAKVSKHKNAQIILIPNEMKISENEVYIEQVGKGFFLAPKEDPWFLLRKALGAASSETFERNQPIFLDK